MHLAESASTSVLLAAAGALIVMCVIFSRASKRLGVPVAMIFLAIGIAAGSDGLGDIYFDDYAFAFRVGTTALALILFDGGLNTRIGALRTAIVPASVLATLGVLGTAAIVGVAAHAFGLSWLEAFLLGSIISSTDAAAVFSVLRGSGIHLNHRLATTLEVESGLNDPMAVILTTALTVALGSDAPPGWHIVQEVVLQMTVGAALGIAIGYAARFVLTRIKLTASGLYPVLTMGIAFFAFGVPSLVYGSGFLAVYVAAVIVGNGDIPYRSGLIRVHDALAWFSQVAMFLLLGLLVFPAKLVQVAEEGFIIALFLAFIARPLTVLVCLLPFRFRLKEVFYIGWVGLRGAVPIILAMIPILARLQQADMIFNIVFFVVVINSIVPGSTVGWLTKKLRLEAKASPPPPAVLEITSMQQVKGEILSFYIGEAALACGSTIADLDFPPDAAVMLLVRGQELVAPKGGTVLTAGDHIYVFCRPDDVGLVHLVFGASQDEA